MTTVNQEFADAIIEEALAVIPTHALTTADFGLEGITDPYEWKLTNVHLTNDGKGRPAIAYTVEIDGHSEGWMTSFSRADVGDMDAESDIVQAISTCVRDVASRAVPGYDKIVEDAEHEMSIRYFGVKAQKNAALYAAALEGDEYEISFQAIARAFADPWNWGLEGRLSYVLAHAGICRDGAFA